MPRPPAREPGESQESLFAVANTEQTPGHRRHSLAFARAIKAAKSGGLLEDVDEAVASLALAGAWSLDAFEAQNKPYGPTHIIEQLRDLLGVMHMTPESRGQSTDDAIADLVAQMTSTDTQADDEAALHHPPA